MTNSDSNDEEHEAVRIGYLVRRQHRSMQCDRGKTLGKFAGKDATAVKPRFAADAQRFAGAHHLRSSRMHLERNDTPTLRQVIPSTSHALPPASVLR